MARRSSKAKMIEAMQFYRDLAATSGGAVTFWEYDDWDLSGRLLDLQDQGLVTRDTRQDVNEEGGVNCEVTYALTLQGRVLLTALQ